MFRTGRSGKKTLSIVIAALLCCCMVWAAAKRVDAEAATAAAEETAAPGTTAETAAPGTTAETVSTAATAAAEETAAPGTTAETAAPGTTAETSAAASTAAAAEETANPEKDPLNEITSVYSAGSAQIITRDDGTKELADTVIYFYQDGSYRQYIMCDGTASLFSEGVCVLKGNPEPDSPVIVTLTVRKVFMGGQGSILKNMSYDVNLSSKDNYCLYPAGAEDKKITAAFLQADKQKLVREDGSIEYLPTMWFYYNDGTFRQYALPGGTEAVLFSSGDYSIKGSFSDKESVLTIHRDKKYADGTGLTDYDSTHDYVIGELDFIRIYPDQVIGQQVSFPKEYADELIVKTGQNGKLVSVYEKASVETALAQGSDDGYAGWLFSIGKVSTEELKDSLCGDMSGETVFAKDVEGGYYIYYHPTDVRLVRDSGYTDEALAHWEELIKWADSVRTAFVDENDGLIAVTYDNSDPAIALSRAAWEDGIKYEIRTLEYGQHGPLQPADVDASPFVERLIRNAKYEYVDSGETPDGEYIILAFPEENVRYDFFLSGDYVRRTNDEGTDEQLFRVTLDEGEEVRTVMQEWARTLAAANGLD